MSDEIYKFMSIDPGGSKKHPTTGVTCWSPVGKALMMDQFTTSELIEFLKTLKNKGIKVIIYESYRIRPDIPQIWSEVLVIQTIGILIGWATANDIELVKLEPSVKKIAELWSGQKSPKKHDISHGPDSYLIGYYHLHKIGIIPPRVLKNYGKDKGSSKSDS